MGATEPPSPMYVLFLRARARASRARPSHIATLAILEKERDYSQSDPTETGALLLIFLSIINYRKNSVTLLSV